MLYSSIIFDYIGKAHTHAFKVKCSLVLSSREKLIAECIGGCSVCVSLLTQGRAH